MAALDAYISSMFQSAIVFCCQLILVAGQIIIFVDLSDVDAHGTGLAMVAVDAFANGVRWTEGADDRIVSLFDRGV